MAKSLSAGRGCELCGDGAPALFARFDPVDGHVMVCSDCAHWVDMVIVLLEASREPGMEWLVQAVLEPAEVEE